jgi:hypothetical protein
MVAKNTTLKRTGFSSVAQIVGHSTARLKMLYGRHLVYTVMYCFDVILLWLEPQLSQSFFCSPHRTHLETCTQQSAFHVKDG